MYMPKTNLSQLSFHTHGSIMHTTKKSLWMMERWIDGCMPNKY